MTQPVRPVEPARPILATYRLQLNSSFDFKAARGVIPYLARLGVSHLYLSPVWVSRPGSTHGYDVVDHTAINPELGGREEFDRLVAAAHEQGIGLVLDCVPNHMGVGYDNPWWVDVLTWGRASPYASFFDIDWTPTEPTLHDSVLLPILGDHYGRVLEQGELVPAFQDGRLVIRYFDHTLPVFPRDTGDILEAAAALAESDDAAAGQTLRDLAQLAKSIARRRERVSRQHRRADRDRADALEKQMSAAWDDPVLQSALNRALVAWTPASKENAAAANSDGRAADRLHRLLERQAYRVAFWRLAAQEINYRRFFDINDLAGLRMEEPALFAAAHTLVLELTASGAADGLRLDHVDGLLDPAQYLQRLGRATRRADGSGPAIFVEKIVAPDEDLRPDWPIDGATGYDVMSELHRLQIDPSGQKPLMSLYETMTGDTMSFHHHVVRAKRLTMASSLSAELNVLANNLNRLAKRSRLTRDYSLTGLREGLANIVAHFAVYRTYIGQRGASETDRAVIDHAVNAARRAATTPDLSIYDFLRSVLTTDAIADKTPGFTADKVTEIARKVQQYTGPVTAKSIEDTTFYRWIPLASMNEVGNEPDHFAMSVEAFHRSQRRRFAAWPRSMVATATHDHKRGEDVRARLAVLSELPKAWKNAVRHWARLNARKISDLDDGPAPGPVDAYLYYQSLVGIWPIGLQPDDTEGLARLADRLKAYMEKAGREAKTRTSWSVTNEPYEQGVRQFIGRSLDPQKASAFLRSVAAFVESIAPAGAINGLAQTVLKLTVPGVPDTYQGTEFWDLSLVDPDNRRPVDYAGRLSALSGAVKDAKASNPGKALSALCATWGDGRIKQAVVARLLAARKADPHLFLAGDYVPLTAVTQPGDSGPARELDTVVAFARVLGDRALVIAVPRLVAGKITDPASLAIDWGGAHVLVDSLFPDAGSEAGGDGLSATCLFTGRRFSAGDAISIADVAGQPPVMAVLVTIRNGR